MKLDEFEKKLVIFAKNSTDKISPSNVSYYLDISISEAKIHLNELANNSIINIDFDEDGNIFFDFPNMTRIDNKNNLNRLLNFDSNISQNQIKNDQRLCPYCQNPIHPNAKKCVYCKEILDVTLVRRNKKSFPHLAHFILSLITFGLTLPFWILHYIFRSKD